MTRISLVIISLEMKHIARTITNRRRGQIADVNETMRPFFFYVRGEESSRDAKNKKVPMTTAKPITIVSDSKVPKLFNMPEPFQKLLHLDVTGRE